MISKELARELSNRLHEDEELLQERLDTIGTLARYPLPALKEGLSTRLDGRKLPRTISNERYHETSTHVITHDDAKVRAKLFSEADEHERRALAQYRYSTLDPDKDRLMALHKAATDDGILIIIPPDANIEEPISVVSNYDTNGFCHVIIIAQRGSKATITRKVHEQKRSAGRGLVCEAVEVFAEEDAYVTYNEHQDLDERTSWYSQKHATAKTYSTIRWYSHVQGGDLSRQETTSRLAGNDSEAISLCTTSIKEQQHTLNEAAALHLAPGTRSGMYAKAVAADQAKTIHKGLVHIHKEAREARAYQQQDIIITDEGAQADTIPQLEINNHEVECSHGSTIGNIDDEQLFYLRSRGIGEERARKLITKGFLKSITDHANDEEWRAQIEKILSAREEEKE